MKKAHQVYYLTLHHIRICFMNNFVSNHHHWRIWWCIYISRSMETWRVCQPLVPTQMVPRQMGAHTDWTDSMWRLLFRFRPEVLCNFVRTWLDKNLWSYPAKNPPQCLGHRKGYHSTWRIPESKHNRTSEGRWRLWGNLSFEISIQVTICCKLANIVTNDIDLITGPHVVSMISLPPASQSPEDMMIVLAIKWASTTLKDGFRTCLSYNREDLTMAVDIFSMMTTKR